MSLLFFDLENGAPRNASHAFLVNFPRFLMMHEVDSTGIRRKAHDQCEKRIDRDYQKHFSSHALPPWKPQRVQTNFTGGSEQSQRAIEAGEKVAQSRLLTLRLLGEEKGRGPFTSPAAERHRLRREGVKKLVLRSGRIPFRSSLSHQAI